MKPRRNGAAALSPAVVMILLDGWGAKLVGEDDGRSDPAVFALAGDWLDEDSEADAPVALSSERGVVKAWRTHEVFLRAEAKRLHISPGYELPSGECLFYGELCCLPLAEQMAYWAHRTAEAAAAMAGDENENDA
jgi:hypothetical protein